METVSNRFVMWGIWAMAIQIYRDRKFKPCAAVLYWHREPVGYLSVHTRLGRELAPTATAAGNEGATETMKPMSVASQGNASSLMADDGLRILFEYGEHTLSSLDLFLAAFPVLTAVAEKGADYQCAEFRVEGYNTPDRVGFAVQADQDARGNVKLKYEHVRKAVQQIIFSMVVHKRFKNVRFVVELDGVKIGHGEWTKKPAAETSPTIGGSATA